MSDSSKRWLNEHFNDTYVKQAQKEGYRSRAAYKLLEINTKDKIIKRGMRVVDLGAAPGGWSMVARDLVGPKGQVIALDILKMDPMAGVEIIQGDFTEQAVLDQLLKTLNNQPVDLVISDMAPNISGMKSIDQPRAMYLNELALECAQQILKPSGSFLAKLFQGAGVEEFVKALRPHFKQVKWRKPDASRARSREIYVLGTGFVGYNAR